MAMAFTLKNKIRLLLIGMVILPLLVSGFISYRLIITSIEKNAPGESAKIDGCSPWGTFVHIMAPLSTSALATLPLLIVFFLAQKWFVESIALSGIK